MKLSRRTLLGMGASLAALSSSPLLAGPRLDAARPLPPSRDGALPGAGQVVDIDLHAKVRKAVLHGLGELPLWTYHDDILPVIRVPQGARLRTRFKNDLPEHTSIHWHGIRLPNHMDGVPYVTQRPVYPGEDYAYDFTLPDAGMFPFHSHCNTVEQLGRGLAGALIVTGDETRPYDADLVCVIKDWRLAEDGTFLDFLEDESASRAGTFGTRRSVNFTDTPTLEAPANGDVRLRLMNVDNSRVNQVGLEGAVDVALIATDGQAVSPQPFKVWRIGSAMRIDLCVRMPKAGEEVKVYDYFAPEPVLLATIKAMPSDIQHGDFDPAPLIAPQIAEPDIANAEFRRVEFSATAQPTPVLTLPDGSQMNIADELCLSDKTFWAINKTTWPEDGHERLPAPVLTLQKDKTYVFELVNATPHMHPIHIHGHSFLYLKSNKRSLPKHFTDTVLLKPKERIHVAFKADNPGDWMFHCHIIEHAETGMMSILRVT